MATELPLATQVVIPPSAAAAGEEVDEGLGDALTKDVSNT